jgi:hypothetical protein
MPIEKDYISQLLGALASLAVQRGSRLTKIRLVKFLYLFDLYWAQSESRTYSNWPWAFVHFGPYCRESTDAIDLAEKNRFLSAESYESQYGDEDYRLYGPGPRIENMDIDRVLGSMPIHVSARLNSALKRWYDDTYGLLNYVYFHTGPMEHARPGEALSFSSEKVPDMGSLRPVKMLSLSNKKKVALREAVKNIEKESRAYEPPSGLFDDEYFEFLSKATEPETEVGTTGVAKLNFESQKDD